MDLMARPLAPEGRDKLSDLKTEVDSQYRTEIRDGFRVEWDVPIEMDDGLILRANVYRPIEEGEYPVIMTYGPYAKDLAWQEGYATVWELFSKGHPDAIEGSSNIHQSWETVDPEQWVPDGYVCIRAAGAAPVHADAYVAIRDRKSVV